MRERGLKLIVIAQPPILRNVSLPMRERGLKPRLGGSEMAVLGVAPHAGAWIETLSALNPCNTTKVAPHAGAWIETLQDLATWRSASGSLPMRERGLKLADAGGQDIDCVAPHAGAWIETGPRRPGQRRLCRRSPCGSVD